MFNLLISVVSLSITLFVVIFVFDAILMLYKLAKKNVLKTIGKGKKQEDKPRFNTKCNDDISPACRKCAYRSECWTDLGILTDIVEVSENEKKE